jgi:hypothetical protein
LGGSPLYLLFLQEIYQRRITPLPQKRSTAGGIVNKRTAG